VLTGCLRAVTIPLTYFVCFLPDYTLPVVTKEGLIRRSRICHESGIRDKGDGVMGK